MTAPVARRTSTTWVTAPITTMVTTRFRFRNRFWLSLGLSLPVVFYSPMAQHWFGYSASSFVGDSLVAPVLGIAVYLYEATRRVRSGRSLAWRAG